MMSRKLIILLLLFYILPVPLPIKAQIAFEKNIRIQLAQQPSKIIYANNQLYISGAEFNKVYNVFNSFFLNISLQGDSIKYVHEFDSLGSNSFYSISNSNNIFGIGYRVNKSTFSDATVLKYNFSLDTPSTIFSSNRLGAENFLSGLVYNDSIIYVVGWYEYANSNPYNGDVYLAKINTTNGTLYWSKLYGGINVENGLSISLSSNNTLIICGETYSYTPRSPNGKLYPDGYIIEVDTAGKLLWQKNYTVRPNATNTRESFNSIYKSKYGGYYCAGGLHDDDVALLNDDYETEPWMIKINDTGKIVWQKRFYLDANAVDKQNWDATSIIQLEEQSDGNLVFIANCNDYTNGQINSDRGFICKYNPFCDTIIWRYDWGGLNKDFEAHSFVIIPDGSIYFVLRNNTHLQAMGGSDIFLVKINNNGKVSETCLPIFNHQEQPFPNPFSKYFRIEIDSKMENATLLLYNTLGELVDESYTTQIEFVYNKKYIYYDGSKLTNGLYFYQIIANGNVISKGKVVKQ